MAKVLSQEQIEFYKREGHLYPLDGTSPQHAANLLEALDESRSIHMELAPGRFSIHHEPMAHVSRPNDSRKSASVSRSSSCWPTTPGPSAER